jgi:hypothetical protein
MNSSCGSSCGYTYISFNTLIDLPLNKIKALLDDLNVACRFVLTPRVFLGIVGRHSVQAWAGVQTGKVGSSECVHFHTDGETSVMDNIDTNQECLTVFPIVHL